MKVGWGLRAAPSPLLLAVLAGGGWPAEPGISVDLGGGVSIDLVLVKAGKFLQGSPAGEEGRGDDESMRETTISRDFYIGKHPVTRNQFGRFVAATGYRTEAEIGTSGGYGLDGGKLVQKKEYSWRNPGFPQTDDHPVVLVTWFDAEKFAEWLSAKSARRVSLPTEAQWEFACRAGTSTRFHAGDSDEDGASAAWFATGDGTRAVGQKRANGLGIHDMSGNVWEWCLDWYGPYPPGPAVDPLQTRQDLSDKPRRVLRGGSWMKEARHCRSAARFRNDARSRNADNGFRVVASTEVRVEAPRPADTQAAGPPAPAEPIRFPDWMEAQRKSSWDDLGIVIAILLGCFIIIVIAVIASSRRKRPIAALPPVPLRPAEDGFWADTARLQPGSTVRYSCVRDGQPETGSFVVEPGSGQFIYTGTTPSEVALVEIIAARAAKEAHRRRWEQDERAEAPREPDESPFRGFPSAY